MIFILLLQNHYGRRLETISQETIQQNLKVRHNLLAERESKSFLSREKSDSFILDFWLFCQYVQ